MVRVLAFFALPILAVPVAAATIVVDPAGGGQFASIQPALDAAAAGDTVLVRPGEYLLVEPLDFNRLHDPGNPVSPPVKDLVLRAEAGPETTVLRMSQVPADLNRGSVLVFENGETAASTVEGFTLTGGTGTGGFSGDVGTGGGGIFCSGSSPSIVGCAIVRNTGSMGGGILLEIFSSPAVTRCTISGNLAGTWGGGVECHWEGCSPVFTECVIAGNAAGYEGGGVHSSSTPNPTFVHCTIAGNSAEYRGGGIWGMATLDSTIVWGNPGGSVFAYDPAHLKADYSCIEGSGPWPGTGNIAVDPLFCGWGVVPEVYVDASFADAGNGSQARPYRTLAEALDFNLTISGASPCWGAGRDRTAIGAEVRTEPCTGPTVLTRSVHIAAGTYDTRGLTLAWSASLFGAGRDATVIEGSVVGSRTGTSIEDLTVRTGFLTGLAVPAGESPSVRRSAFRSNGGRGGVWTGQGSAASFSGCDIVENSYGGIYSIGSGLFEDCTIAGNVDAGILCSSEGAPILRRCRIAGNTGNGLSCPGSSPVLQGCTITGNAFTGLWCDDDSFPVLEHCTIAGNGEGIGCDDASSATLVSCIVWDDVHPSLRSDDEEADPIADPYWLKARQSCIRSEPVWPGEGNTNADPLFCGRGPRPEVHVDASKPWPGDGSQENPYPALAPALDYSLELSAGSPCIGTGEGGSNMGSEGVGCNEAGVPEILVRVAAGTYNLRGLTVGRGVSLAGAGRDATTIEGTIFGLQTGSVLSDLTVTGGASSGIVVKYQESPRIERCAVKGNVSSSRDSGGGIFCEMFSAPIITGCEISGNAAPIAGGGIYADSASPLLEDCVIAGNWSGKFGGGLCFMGGSPAIRNCEVWGNAAGLEGGGIYSGGAPPGLLHSTVAGNSPLAMYCWIPGQATVLNSIVSGGLELNPEASLLATGSLLEGDPLFLDPGSFDFTRFRVDGPGGSGHPLPDFVLRRPDLRLATESPAIDIDLAPCDLGLAHDIAGVPRPSGDGCDAGAHEYDGSGPRLFFRGRANDDGRVDLSDMVFVLTYLFLGGSAPGCIDAADMNDDGGIDITDPIFGLASLFLGGPAIPAPSEACGPDPTPDDLGCASSPDCP